MRSKIYILLLIALSLIIFLIPLFNQNLLFIFFAILLLVLFLAGRLLISALFPQKSDLTGILSFILIIALVILAGFIFFNLDIILLYVSLALFIMFFLISAYFVVPEKEKAAISNLVTQTEIVWDLHKFPSDLRTVVYKSFDLNLTILFTFLAVVFILVPPFNQIPFLRIPLALPLLLFFPGYALISAMFPRKEELTGIERFTLSIGLSIAIFVFDGFALSVSPWLFRPNSISISLFLITLFFVITTCFVRVIIPQKDRFLVTLQDAKKFFYDLRSAFSDLIHLRFEDATDIEKALVVALIGSIIIASGMVIYANLTREPEKFTALYILGAGGKAENYPTNLTLGEPTNIIVGVENYEHAPTNYTLQIKLDGDLIKSQEIKLNFKDKWKQSISFIPHLIGYRLKLEFLLFKEKVTDTPYRSVHLWVSSKVDYNNTKALMKFVVPPPRIPNGNMESLTNWTYIENGLNFTGNYTNTTYESPLHSYLINYSSSSKGKSGYYGAIYQDITPTISGLMFISFEVKDSYPSNRSAGYFFKQVLLNNKVIWEEDIAEENGECWHKARVPVTLLANKTYRLTLRVYEKKDINSFKVKVWWDNVKIETPTSFYILTKNLTNIYFGEPTSIKLGIDNYEPKPANYTLQVKLKNKLLKSQNIRMDFGSKWIQNVSFIPEEIGSDLKLEFLLYKEGVEEPYRSDYLLVNSTIDYNNTEILRKYAIPPPIILNEDMESNKGWVFTQNGNFTGNYTNSTSVSPIHSYEISYPSGISSKSGDYGAISQNITTKSIGFVSLSFDVKDSHYSEKNKGYHFKQVVLNEEVVWEKDVAGDDGWQRIKIPIFLPNKTNRLTLRVYEKKGVSSFGIKVWWDNVLMENFTGLEINITNITGYQPPIIIKGNVSEILKINQTTMERGKTKQLKIGYSLVVKDIDIISNKVILELRKNKDLLKYDILEEGDIFKYKVKTYNATEVTIFKCKVDKIITGVDKSFVMLKDIVLNEIIVHDIR